MDRAHSVVETGKRNAYLYRGTDGYLTVVDRSEGDDPCWLWRVESSRGVQVASGWERKFKVSKRVGNAVARAVAEAREGQ